eukprot:TRINITY_DN1856_c0_g1_i1.p2 TRINITY_DN1856_c0_g1~~TRINITY_DN1856_c0_g1_i1.p2  ORF type:complete len:146 (+),score=14.17 TRINITY_DN1856_c0_g1_i1:76-513(+)
MGMLLPQSSNLYRLSRRNTFRSSTPVSKPGDSASSSGSKPDTEHESGVEGSDSDGNASWSDGEEEAASELGDNNGDSGGEYVSYGRLRSDWNGDGELSGEKKGSSEPSSVLLHRKSDSEGDGDREGSASNAESDVSADVRTPGPC